MNKSLWQQFRPHAIAIGIFLLVSVVYCLPVLQGMVANSFDVLSWRGMSHQSFEFKEKYGYFPLWTNSMFSGMPTFQIMAESKYNVTVAHLNHLFTFFLPTPAGLFFLACIGFYILSLSLRLKTWPAVFGSLAYAFSTYNAILVATGHTTKFSSMGYAPAVLAGLILLTQRKYVLGFMTTFLFGTLLFYQNHVQVVYYTLLIAVCLGIAFLVQSIKSKDYVHLGKVAGLAALGGLIAFGSYTVTLLSTYDYAKETMRGGKSELTDTSKIIAGKANRSQSGLDRDYAFYWSYGITETSTLMVANARGDGTSKGLPEDSKTVATLQESGLPQDAVNYLFRNAMPYWGDQEQGTGGPVYMGAIVCMLFIASLFVVRSWHLGWLVAATVLGIMMSWGKNLPGFNYFLFDYLPFYNKFRAPSMALIIPQLTISALAAMALQSLLYGEWTKDELMKKLKQSGIAIGAVVAILGITYVAADFRGPTDNGLRQAISDIERAVSQGNPNNTQASQQLAGLSSSLFSSLKADRQAMYIADYGRSVIFIVLAAALVFMGATGRLKPLHAALGITILSFVDLIGVDTRYLGKENYVTEEELMAPFAANAADNQIKQDTSYYRVFDQTDATSARSAYHHNSVTGYHPAKLSLYDDILQKQLSAGNMNMFNMLNTKYFIAQNPQNGQPVVQTNPGALGAAWLVKTIRYVNSADEEMAALGSLENPRDTVLIDKREQKKVPFAPQFDSTASIQLVFNRNDVIQYSSNATTNQFAVFSEIYYPRGWKAYVDGKETEIVKVNYALRGLPLTPGKHVIDFKFVPESFLLGDKIGLVVGIISFILLFGCLWLIWKQYKNEQSGSGPGKPGSGPVTNSATVKA